VTLWYRAPEIICRKSKYDLTVDIWSLGCIFGEMIDGKCLFQGDSEIGTLFKIFHQLGTPTLSYSNGNYSEFKHEFPKFEKKPFAFKNNIGDDAIDLLMCMLSLTPESRPNATNCLKHPFLKSLDTSMLPVKYE